MNEDNPRATQIVTSKDQQLVQQTLDQLQTSNHVNAFFVLNKFIECGDVKNEPEFCQILFEDHLDVIIELIQWMLTPKQVVKRKKLKINVDSYPYQCRQFMKDNWCFYEQLYIAARNKKLQFGTIFNFLRKDYFDKDTIYTALGYFTDVMIPFAKYQFSGSFNLSMSVEVTSQNKKVQTLSIMKILPESLIDQLINYCHYEPIFQFLKTSVLVSIQDPRDYQISRSASLKMLKGVKLTNLFSKFPICSPTDNDIIAKSIDYLENISTCFKQLIQNIQPTNNQFLFRNNAFIQTILQSNIIKEVIDELTKSRFCGLVIKEKQRQHSNASQLSQLTDAYNLTMANIIQISQNFNQNMLPSIGSFPILTDSDEEQLVQVLLKILSSSVQIFVRIPRTLNFHQEEGYCQIDLLAIPSRDSITEQTVNKSSSKSNYKQKPKQITFQSYSSMIGHYKQIMQYLLNSLETLTKFVYNQSQDGGSSFAKVIPFSTDQNVKAISFMKFQYFRLLHNCLIMIQTKQIQNQKQTQLKQKQPPNKLKKMKSVTMLPFDVKIQKFHALQIIKKYLVQNRWNNLAHHILQKICHLLIMCNYDYIKKNIQKDQIKKFSQSFLSYLIQNFTKRDFVFLNTVKFTPQGNLHSLYNISKDLAYTLNSTNQLVVFLNQFEPWKKFIMNDLKNYEQKTFPKAIKPEFYENSQDQAQNIKVDEVDSIKKLIQNISTAPKKWPIRVKNKNLSKSGVFSKDDLSTNCKKPQQYDIKYSGQYTAKKIQKKRQFGLEEILKKKIQSSRISKQVKQFNIDDISVKNNVKREQEKKKNQHKDQLVLKKSSSQIQLPISHQKSQVKSQLKPQTKAEMKGQLKQ